MLHGPASEAIASTVLPLPVSEVLWLDAQGNHVYVHVLSVCACAYACVCIMLIWFVFLFVNEFFSRR